MIPRRRRERKRGGCQDGGLTFSAWLLPEGARCRYPGVSMRYLFGDSTPFPLPFDFLRTLEAFMTAGTRVLLLEHRGRKLSEETLATQLERAKGLETLSRFHEAQMRSLGEALVPKHPYAVEYAQRLAEHALSLVTEQRRSVQESNERGEARVRSESDRTGEEIATHLRTFFLTARLPTQGKRLSTTLVDGRPDARASLVHPGGVGVTFTLGTAKAPAWSAPRKLSELVGHIELTVGIKKSWIGNKISREPVRLDDWVVSSADLDETTATIALRRRPDQKESLIFKLRRDEAGFGANFEHPGDPNAELVPSAAEASDLPHLERLWTAIAATFDEILEERTAITAVSLDSEDVFEQRLGQKLVERLVMVLGPTTLEVARRSPNQHELSLKREGDNGRREELYLKRDQLLEGLQPLPREGRAVFAPLGLDGWVPATTMRPPNVVPSEMRVEELISIDIEEV